MTNLLFETSFFFSLVEMSDTRPIDRSWTSRRRRRGRSIIERAAVEPPRGEGGGVADEDPRRELWCSRLVFFTLLFFEFRQGGAYVVFGEASFPGVEGPEAPAVAQEGREEVRRVVGFAEEIPFSKDVEVGEPGPRGARGGQGLGGDGGVGDVQDGEVREVPEIREGLVADADAAAQVQDSQGPRKPLAPEVVVSEDVEVSELQRQQVPAPTRKGQDLPRLDAVDLREPDAPDHAEAHLPELAARRTQRPEVRRVTHSRQRHVTRQPQEQRRRRRPRPVRSRRHHHHVGTRDGRR
mmetsp:Transcript_28163/g.90779  ORF Transcript_28163/g.90779 Transcript_28163/m.90779 type:complete len:295 (-) Transcript_28163:33-917(-)